MPVICAAYGCSNKFVKGSEIRFYRFPLSKPQLSTQWVKSLTLGSMGMKDPVPNTNTCLCSKHFHSDCFCDQNGKQFLKEDAVPTIHLFSRNTRMIHQRPTLNSGNEGLHPRMPTLPANFWTQAVKDRRREIAGQRREKRGGARGRRGGGQGRRGVKISIVRQTQNASKSKVYDTKGWLITSSKDLSDCLVVDLRAASTPALTGDFLFA